MKRRPFSKRVGTFDAREELKRTLSLRHLRSAERAREWELRRGIPLLRKVLHVQASFGVILRNGPGLIHGQTQTKSVLQISIGTITAGQVERIITRQRAFYGLRADVACSPRKRKN